MTYLEFEKEYNESRPIEPYFVDDVGWSEIAHYAEDNLQRAFNLGYCECYHEAKDIIERLLVFIPKKHSYIQEPSDEIRMISEKFIKRGSGRL